jgi:hypothetical protein
MRIVGIAIWHYIAAWELTIAVLLIWKALFKR